MSFYPISMIKRLTLEAYDRTVADPFESGATYARNTWPAGFFKRRFRLDHSPLTLQEWLAFKAFYHARSGTYDSFWFRDNLNRAGHANVRFASRLQADFQQGARLLSVDLVEVAAVRALVELEEITTAAGTAPILWLDPNREIYYQHMGTVYQGETNLYDPISVSGTAYTTTKQAGAMALGALDAQCQGYSFNGTFWAKTSANIAEIAAATPACTIFLMAKHSAAAANQVLFSLGSYGAGQCLGLGMAANGNYSTFIGSDTNWAAALIGNDPASTWRSISVAYTASSTTCDVRVNGAAAMQVNESRSFVEGPASLGAASSGALPANPANAMTTNLLAQILVFPATLSLAQVTALHNLIAPPYGVAAA